MMIVIVTSAHWAGDPRLNRHKAYLEQAGHQVELKSYAHRPRPLAVAKAMSAIARTNADVVVLPDPELFLVGSLAARLRRVRPVIDIHEDYPKAAAARSWVPRPLRGLVAALAHLSIALGRRAAAKVVVAAPQLAAAGDTVVLNIPNPSGFDHASDGPERRLVYVGDITLARGAVQMVQALARLDSDYELVLVGRVEREARDAIESEAGSAGVSDRVRFAGRLPHDEAWSLASGAIVGLNLLQDAPAYREAVATKLWEYMASGIPPVVSDLPGQAAVISAISGDLVCTSASEVASIVDRLDRDRETWSALVEKGLQQVRDAWSRGRPDLAVQTAVEP